MCHVHVCSITPLVLLVPWSLIVVKALSLIFPALLNSLPHTLDVFTLVILEKIGCFDIGRRGCIGVVEKTE